MDVPLFESLLREEESEVLDFKREQYPFSKASDDEKSELLKDILGFANAWRRTDAYILIGVEDVRGGRGHVVGISGHLDDHSLQQFVNHQTNRPIRFRYEAFTYEGCKVGVIRIDLAQTRPIYLRRDYGKLAQERVYVRRGSATDPTKPATPEEIAEMGRSLVGASEQPELLVQFADTAREVAAGLSLRWTACNLKVPPRGEIPDFSVAASSARWPSLDSPNPGYYRSLANYAAFLGAFRLIRLVIENRGKSAARDVRVEFEALEDGPIEFVDASDAPQEPRRFYSIGLSPALDALRPAQLRREPGDVSVVDSGHGCRLEVDCGDLQPGRLIWSEAVFMAVRRSGPATLAGTIYASNLAEPGRFALTVDATVTEQECTIVDLRRLAAQVAKDS